MDAKGYLFIHCIWVSEKKLKLKGHASTLVQDCIQEAKAKKMQTVISFGTAILGAFLGRKAVSATSASRVGTAIRSASGVQKEKMDVARARERAEAIHLQLSELDERLQEDIDAIELSFDIEAEELEEISVKPKSTDITLEIFGLAWMPFRKDAGGGLSPDWG